MIPKRLHFTWKSEALPPVMQRYFEAWKRLHPDYEITLWTDATMRDFVAAAWPELLATYDAYPKMIQRADSFRYMVLGKLGGVYADLDVEPFQSIDKLLELNCFVGVEPLEHIGTDRTHQGVPMLMSNAFMGSVPGHPMWTAVCAGLPALVGQETFYSTGPSMVTAVGLRLPLVERPALLLPEVWSPLLSNGLRTRSDAKLRELLAPVGRVVGAESGTLVSHKWHTTWVPWHKRNSPYSGLFQWPTTLKWWLRRRKYPELAATVIPDPVTPYFDQDLQPSAATPKVRIAVRLHGEGPSEALAKGLAELSYPKDKFSITYHAQEQGVDACVQVVGDEEYVLLVDGSVTAIPGDALQWLLGAGRPVVAANCIDSEGKNADPGLFRYRYGGKFQVLYKDGAIEGRMRRDPGHRSYLGEQMTFNILPVDGVGESFVLIKRDVIEAGVRFSETPYKFHTGGEAFGIMARDKGFEAAGLPGVKVVRSV
jgi:hypothetical protein